MPNHTRNRTRNRTRSRSRSLSTNELDKKAHMLATHNSYVIPPNLSPTTQGKIIHRAEIIRRGRAAAARYNRGTGSRSPGGRRRGITSTRARGGSFFNKLFNL